MADIYHGSVQIPKLKKGEYHGWKIQFDAGCGVKGVGRALMSSFDANLPGDSDYGPSDFVDAANPTADEKKKYRAVTKNNLAVSLIYSSISPELAVEAKGKCGTADWPLGKAHELMKFIEDKNVVNDSLTPAELKLAINEITMNGNDDPETLDTQVAHVKLMHASVGKTVDEDILVAQLLSVAPKDYASVLATEQSIIESKGEDVTAEKLAKAMRRQYRIANPKTQANKNDETELESDNDKEVKEEAALVTANGGENH